MYNHSPLAGAARLRCRSHLPKATVVAAAAHALCTVDGVQDVLVRIQSVASTICTAVIAAVMMMIILDSLQFAHWHASANCDERCSRRAEACRRLLDGRGGRGLLATTVPATTKSSCAVLLDDRYRTVRRRAACVYRRACIWRGGGQWGARPSGCRARLQLQARGLRAVRDCSCSCAACLLL